MSRPLIPTKEEMAASISYFKPLDWYIGVTVPVQEIQRPARDLVVHQSTLIAVMLALGLLGSWDSWYLRIASPLRCPCGLCQTITGPGFYR